MLLKIKCLSQDGTYDRVVNMRNIIYFDERGIMFAPGTHSKLAAGEYERMLDILYSAKSDSVIA